MNNLIVKNIEVDIKEDTFSENIFDSLNQDIVNLKQEIKNIVIDFCNKNEVNIEKQEYVISGFIESSSNLYDGWYSLCTEKYFNFFGKYYFDKTYDMKELLKNSSEEYEYTVDKNMLLVCMHHFYNKVVSNNANKYIEFYVAPKALLSHFDLNKWVRL
jgi:hypothetical protein